MTITLHDKIDMIKGIGPKISHEFQEIDISKIQDLLDYFPFRYEDRNYVETDQLIDGMQLTIIGYITKKPYIHKRGRMSRLIATISCEALNRLECIWFNQPYLIHTLTMNAKISVTGKYSAKHRQITVNNYEIINNLKTSIHTGGTIPIYLGTKNLKTNALRKWIAFALNSYSSLIKDSLPIELIERYKLVDKKTAYQWIHFPSNENELIQAKRRLVFEEFFLYQMKLQLIRAKYKENKNGISRQYERQILQSFIKRLSFELTNAQKTCLKEILADMKSSKPMYRLLHGDVGSGKTMVATIALLASWSSKYQSALMVPTEILAEQHYSAIKKDIEYTGVRVCILTSKLTKTERKLCIKKIKEHQYDIVIGTHAILQQDVEFAALGLVIIDEQHRFGVQQRELLTKKGCLPDVLSMTATPIPRTMAMTIYGDFDVSILDELPEGRKRVKTEWYNLSRDYEVLNKIRHILEIKQQVYIVCPLIKESEQLELENVNNIAEKVQEYFTDYQVGTIHGQLTVKEKDTIMTGFIEGDIQILVATTVIEVGVNIPSASAIIIYNAERFGLAQLHQLRGRVGRSNQDAFCYLLTDAPTVASKKRMQAMTTSNDGFYLAEQDLLLRGPGEILGTRQSGLPEFKVGNIIEDFTIMQVARKEAVQFITNQKSANNEYLENFILGSNFLA